MDSEVEYKTIYHKNFKTVHNERDWTRDADDLIAGAMSSIHSVVRVDEKEGQVRAKIIFRDCDTQISYEHWVEGRKDHVDKALKNLHKVRGMLDRYIEKFEETCDNLDNLQ